MAELRIPPAALPLPSAPGRPVAAARAEAIRAAQRTFFDTAADSATQAAPPEAAAVESTPAAAPVGEIRATIDPAAPTPSRLLRPGSLLDIKV